MKQTITALILFGALAAAGATLEKIPFKDKVQLSGTPLVLNGLGLREATIFNVDVYVAGLYVEKKSTNPTTILNAPGKKRMVLKFMRDVDADQMREAFVEGFNNNCTVQCESSKKDLKAFNQKVPSVKKGDVLTFNFLWDQVELIHNKKTQLVLKSKNFGQALLANWIGKHPPGKDLKAGLLGK